MNKVKVFVPKRIVLCGLYITCFNFSFFRTFHFVYERFEFHFCCALGARMRSVKCRERRKEESE